MALRRMLEHIGGKVLPRGGNGLPVAARQHAHIVEAASVRGTGPVHYIGGVDTRDSARAIRRYLQTRRTFTAPDDLEVMFDETSALVVIAGTVPDAETRERIIAAAGNIHGVARIDDRMRLA